MNSYWKPVSVSMNTSLASCMQNLLYVMTLKELPEDITILRGKFGLFFEYDIEDYGIIADCITNKVQTCVYYGVEKNEIQRMVQDNCLMGIDRIVPVGSSLDIELFGMVMILWVS